MSGMAKVKTEVLTGKALDWAVAQAEGITTMMLKVSKEEDKKEPFALFGSLAYRIGDPDEDKTYAPSSCWHCGGPLIAKYALEFEWITDATLRVEIPGCGTSAFAGAHLMAACRAIVKRNLGETVLIPMEILPCAS